MQFDCAEKGCDKKVVYTRVVVSGTDFLGITTVEPKRVWLNCVDGHYHPYEVSE